MLFERALRAMKTSLLEFDTMPAASGLADSSAKTASDEDISGEGSSDEDMLGIHEAASAQTEHFLGLPPDQVHRLVHAIGVINRVAEEAPTALSMDEDHLQLWYVRLDALASRLGCSAKDLAEAARLAREESRKRQEEEL